MLHSSLDYAKPPLDQQIVTLNKEIDRHAATIATLAADGHEVTDAKMHVTHLRQQLEALRRIKTGAT